MNKHVMAGLDGADGGTTQCLGCRQYVYGSLIEVPPGECPTPYKSPTQLLAEAVAREAALRDELGAVKGEYDRAVNKVDALQQRLTAAEQQNAELSSNLEECITEMSLARQDHAVRSAMTVIGRTRFLKLVQDYSDSFTDQGNGERLRVVDGQRLGIPIFAIPCRKFQHAAIAPVCRSDCPCVQTRSFSGYQTDEVKPAGHNPIRATPCDSDAKPYDSLLPVPKNTIPSVELPAFDGYQAHIVRELQAAFVQACEKASIKVSGQEGKL